MVRTGLAVNNAKKATVRRRTRCPRWRSRFFESIVTSHPANKLFCVGSDSFARNLMEPTQADMRDQCLRIWGIPNKARIAPPKGDAASRFQRLTGLANPSTLLGNAHVELKADNLSALERIYNYKCYLTGSRSTIILSMGVCFGLVWLFLKYCYFRCRPHSTVSSAADECTALIARKYRSILHSLSEKFCFSSLGVGRSNEALVVKKLVFHKSLFLTALQENCRKCWI